MLGVDVAWQNGAERAIGIVILVLPARVLVKSLQGDYGTG